jgi:hypothetical protein
MRCSLRYSAIASRSDRAGSEPWPTGRTGEQQAFIMSGDDAVRVRIDRDLRVLADLVLSAIARCPSGGPGHKQVSASLTRTLPWTARQSSSRSTEAEARRLGCAARETRAVGLTIASRSIPAGCSGLPSSHEACTSPDRRVQRRIEWIERESALLQPGRTRNVLLALGVTGMLRHRRIRPRARDRRATVRRRGTQWPFCGPSARHRPRSTCGWSPIRHRHQAWAWASGPRRAVARPWRDPTHGVGIRASLDGKAADRGNVALAGRLSSRSRRPRIRVVKAWCCSWPSWPRSCGRSCCGSARTAPRRGSEVEPSSPRWHVIGGDDHVVPREPASKRRSHEPASPVGPEQRLTKASDVSATCQPLSMVSGVRGRDLDDLGHASCRPGRTRPW